MKRKSSILLCMFVVLMAVSCEKGNTVDTQAVVTVKGETGDRCIFQLDESTVVVPENIATNPFGKEVRAYTLYQDKGETEPNGDSGMKYHRAQIQYVDSMLTKSTVPSLGEVLNAFVYGSAPIDIYNSWMSVVEDGYVTLRFCAKWGTTPIAEDRVHKVNLVRNTDLTDPYTFELRHSYENDTSAILSGTYMDGLIAFNIKDILATESRSSYDITINYIGSSGSKSVVFHYVPGTSCMLGTTNDSNLELSKSFE